MNLYAAITSASCEAFTIDDILAACKKLRDIPKPREEEFFLLVGPDVPRVQGEGVQMGKPVRIMFSDYAKGITPLPMEILRAPMLGDVPFSFEKDI